MPVQNRAAALNTFWQAWNSSQPITDDAEKHRFTEALAGVLNTLDGSWHWGRKARSGTDAKSKDTLGYWIGAVRPVSPMDGKVDAFDVISSSGAVSWDTRAEQGDPLYRNIDARWFPVDAAGPAPSPAPIPQQPPPVPVDAVIARLKVIGEALQVIEEKLDESDAARHRFEQELSGRIDRMMVILSAPHKPIHLKGTVKLSGGVDLNEVL